MGKEQVRGAVRDGTHELGRRIRDALTRFKHAVSVDDRLHAEVASACGRPAGSITRQHAGMAGA